MSTGGTDTVPGNNSTTAILDLVTPVTGCIETAGDADWYRITLTQGQTITVDLVATGAAPLGDTMLDLIAPDGTTWLHANDDYLGKDTSQLTYTATVAGDHLVAVRGYGSATGDFTLSASAGAAYFDAVPDLSYSGFQLTSGIPYAGSFDYGQDDDWFKLDVAPGQYVDVMLTETGSTGRPITLTAITSLGSARTTTSGGDEAALTLRNSTAQTTSYWFSASFDGAAPGDSSGYALTAVVHDQDLTATVQTFFSINDTDPIRVYILSAGETATGITADAASAYEQQRIMAAFDIWSAVADIQFVQTTDRAQADIEVALGDVPPYADAEYPGSVPQLMRISNRVPQWTDAGALDDGGFGYAVVIHEIGHLLGLEHTHQSGNGAILMPGVTGAIGSYGDNDLNQEVFSVMSYNRGWPTGPLGVLPESVTPHGSVYTPSPIDIAAVQRKYGVNTTTGAGDDTYSLQSGNGGYRSIWDVSGTDEISVGGSDDAVIDLRAATLGFEAGGGGFVSHLPAFHGGITIANGVVIENASGGSGNDVLIGNSVGNLMQGNNGNDILHGGLGGDSMEGGEGADTLNGNSGDDTLWGGNGTDSIIGGTGNDLIYGWTGAEVLDGSPGGSDFLSYGSATSQVILRLWNNTVSGDPLAAGDTIRNFENAATGSGNDILQGNHQDNHLIGNGGDDTMTGSAGDDTMIGLAGADSLIGGLGDDVLSGGLGADVLDGSPGGSDTVDYSEATTALFISLWSNTASGAVQATGDTIRNFENVVAGSGNDSLSGNHLANQLVGNDGNDTLVGSGGNDTLYGDAGADSMVGGNGDDMLLGSIGADFMDGSPGGRDLLSYGDATTDLVVRLWNNTVSGDALAAGDTILNFENVSGGGGNDRLVGNHLDNELSGSGGNDSLTGGAGNDTLNGGEGNDILLGGAGQDRLFSSYGRDFQTGGADADVFVFLSAPDLGLGADRDQIMDFEQGLDRIDLSAITPGTIVFRGTSPFAPSGDAEIRLFETGTGSTIVQLDVNGDGVIDGEPRVAGVVGLTASDFIL